MDIKDLGLGLGGVRGADSVVVRSSALGSLTQRQADFADVMSRRQVSGEKPTPRQAAEDFVAISLVQPILKQMREMNQAAPPFAPGPAEKQFRAIADAGLARQMVRSRNWGLVNRLEGDLAKHAAKGTAARDEIAAMPQMPLNVPSAFPGVSDGRAK